MQTTVGLIQYGRILIRRCQADLRRIIGASDGHRQGLRHARVLVIDHVVIERDLADLALGQILEADIGQIHRQLRAAERHAIGQRQVLDMQNRIGIGVIGAEQQVNRRRRRLVLGAGKFQREADRGAVIAPDDVDHDLGRVGGTKTVLNLDQIGQRQGLTRAKIVERIGGCI